jgi:hypothetical protein
MFICKGKEEKFLEVASHKKLHTRASSLCKEKNLKAFQEDDITTST